MPFLTTCQQRPGRAQSVLVFTRVWGTRLPASLPKHTALPPGQCKLTPDCEASNDAVPYPQVGWVNHQGTGHSHANQARTNRSTAIKAQSQRNTTAHEPGAPPHRIPSHRTRILSHPSRQPPRLLPVAVALTDTALASRPAISSNGAHFFFFLSFFKGGYFPVMAHTTIPFAGGGGKHAAPVSTSSHACAASGAAFLLPAAGAASGLARDASDSSAKARPVFVDTSGGISGTVAVRCGASNCGVGGSAWRGGKGG